MSRGGFNTCFEFTIGQEGKYSDDPYDPGNWTGGVVGKGVLAGTCWGISAPTMVSWVGAANAAIVTPEYMQQISLGAARMIYKLRYWAKLKCDDLATGVDLVVWDFGVNAGVPASARTLQQVVGTTQDGIIGPITLDAANSWHPEPLVHALITNHDRYYRSLNDPRHLNGWLNRQTSLQTEALKRISASLEVSS